MNQSFGSFIFSFVYFVVEAEPLADKTSTFLKLMRTSRQKSCIPFLQI